MDTELNQIAQALLSRDISQVEYYEQITKNMVGRVLTNSRQITEKDDGGFRLKDFEGLSSGEVVKTLRTMTTLENIVSNYFRCRLGLLAGVIFRAKRDLFKSSYYAINIVT